MKLRRILRLAALAAIVFLPACQAALIASNAANAITSGFGGGSAPAARTAADEVALPAIESGVRLVQSRTRPGPPRTEREALDQLRARRQEYLDSSR